ncbi:presenilin family intramembrane aspartyl protease [Haloferax sp. AB510]|uniref:presenilin family intramembrane aspartyl protease PSH n=1 Tax=Haloferax sp. AB510 TaxID=2934172 RepID=UPI00209C4429|nr:presenilin family intramembrane aspartyl protease PSH [Haloferax sp. AB510]MCO8266316.1 presenilin family intramembrane aspartyl protease [Haloferax sp. AB510]
MSRRAYRGVALAALIFLVVQVGALALVPTFFEQGYQTVEDPTDPTNSLLYIGAIIVMTAFMLAAFKYDLDQLIRLVIVFTSGLLAWYVFAVLVPNGLVAIALSAGVSLALLVYPEWYVIDAAGALMGAGAAALFGISFGLLPAIVLLSVLAIYDAISVYKTKHMLDLAEGVMDLRIPVVLVIPTTLSYSLLDDDFARDANEVGDGENATDGGEPAEAADAETADAEATDDSDPADRDAFFIGLGDAVMPTVMVASGAFFSEAPSLGFGALPALNLPALLAMVGTFAGFSGLMWAVMKGRAHAGLPLLNGGAIGGYLVGSVVAGVPLVSALGLAPYL